MKRTALGPGAESIARGSTFAAPPTPLDRRSQLDRRTKLPPRTKDERRRARRFALQFGSSEHVALVTSCPCVDCGKPAPSDPSHGRTRGAGGRWWEIGPHCRPCHDAWEDRRGRTEERERRFAAVSLWLARVSFVAGFVPEAPPELDGVDAAAPDFIVRAAGEHLLARKVAVRVAEVGP